MGIPILIHLYKFLGSKGLGDDDLEDIFGEPLVGHHKPTLVPRSITPGILDLVPDRLVSLGVDVYTTDNHCVCHGRFVNLETLLLGQTEFDVEGGL